MEFKELEVLVIKWGEDRNLYHPEHGATYHSQYLKFISEIGELSDAILKGNNEAIKDGLGDSIVCLIAMAKFKNIDLKSINKELVNSESEEWYLPCNNIESCAVIISNTVYLANKQDFRLIKDAIVSLLILEQHLGFEYLECLNFAYNEIKDRKGKLINRTFVKDE